MITNILLGLILGIVIISYIILNKKITQIQSNTEYILMRLRFIDRVDSTNNKLIQQILTKQNEIRFNNISEHNEIITKFNWIDKQVIFTKRNTDDIKQIITDQHIAKKKSSKQAKFSSKIDSKSKVDKQYQK